MTSQALNDGKAIESLGMYEFLGYNILSRTLIIRSVDCFRPLFILHAAIHYLHTANIQRLLILHQMWLVVADNQSLAANHLTSSISRGSVASQSKN